MKTFKEMISEQNKKSVIEQFNIMDKEVKKVILDKFGIKISSKSSWIEYKNHKIEARRTTERGMVYGVPIAFFSFNTEDDKILKELESIILSSIKTSVPVIGVTSFHKSWTKGKSILHIRVGSNK